MPRLYIRGQKTGAARIPAAWLGTNANPARGLTAVQCLSCELHGPLMKDVLSHALKMGVQTRAFNTV